jgi:hypothetical protein
LHYVIDPSRWQAITLAERSMQLAAQGFIRAQVGNCMRAYCVNCWAEQDKDASGTKNSRTDMPV